MDHEPVPDAARRVVQRLALQPHPEGGWFRETHRSAVILPRHALPPGHAGDCPAVTSILFLLAAGQRSRPHRIQSEELWLHHQGDDLRLEMGESPGLERPRRIVLGQGEKAELQAVVPRRWWQAAGALPGPCGYALVACVVAPGFEFADFEMAEG
ncbi:MAG: cupin domain-containing protein [Phycisphaerales bacterium]|nr:MAG: cupin domain-containing protein [Phycisphaerales bacterium]